ncbi:MAG TPA: EAL domain-containing protein [Desulfuromonadales bacterium]|nr:EAL domain-containing protein [Desulfuromonadales bacterium]
MNKASRPLQQMIMVLARGVSLLIALSVPAAYFFIAHQNLVSTLESQCVITGAAVNSIILSNPQMWRFEEVRLAELLERRAHDGVPQFWTIRDKSGQVIAQSSQVVLQPFTTHRRTIYDAGLAVGQLEVTRSLRPILYKTALTALFSTLLATILFFIFRALPMRLMNTAIHELEESEKKYRSLYQTMNEGMALHKVYVDKDGGFSSLTLIDANPSCAEMFGGNPDAIVGRNSFTLFGDTFREFISEMLNNLERGASVSFEMCLPGKDYFYNVQAFSPDKGLVATLFEDITESRKAEQQIQKMAYFDSLTGLPNRALFYDRIKQSIALANREKSSLAVLFLDLDHFKDINDTLGHSVGDQLLIEVSRRLTGHIRANDTLARLGGDEFVVVITHLGVTLNTTYIAQKLIDSIQAPFSFMGKELHVTASVGIALYPDDGDNAETLIKHADMAMYSSKETGRNSYCYFSPAMNKKALMRLENEIGLRHALERGELFIEFQPIIKAATGTIVAAEALVRWNHPERGRIPPTEFIELAEETGLILPLGEFILRSVCTSMKIWRDAGLPCIRYCVNVSSRQIEQQNFPELVRSILDETGAHADQLEIELTESCLVKNIETNVAGVFGMRAWGITIAIDDFGTGYSSLGYIKTLPIDHIKIDRSFVTDVCTSVQDQAIVEAILAMSHKLDIHNIAEGVETREQLEFLQRQGCDEIQGFYFHRPLSVSAFEELLRGQGEKQ